MKTAHPYLFFDGKCREAMLFYGTCLEAEPNFTTFSEGPPITAGAAPERILHAELSKGPMVLMAADTPPGTPFQQGNNFSISVGCDTKSEMEKLFAALSLGGKVTVPMHDAFWGGYSGTLIDRFGTSWMLSFRLDTGANREA